MITKLFTALKEAFWKLVSHGNRERFRRHMRLINALKYSLFFGLFILYLPFTVYSKVPLHNFLGGLFIGLDLWTVFLVAVALTLTMWSLALTQGMTIDGIEIRFLNRGRACTKRGNYIWQKGYIPKWAYTLFNADINTLQLAIYSIPIVVSTVIISLNAEAHYILALIVAAIGTLAGYLLIYFITKVVKNYTKDEDFKPLSNPQNVRKEVVEGIQNLSTKASGYLKFKGQATPNETGDASPQPEKVKIEPSPCSEEQETDKSRFKRAVEYIFPGTAHGLAFIVGIGLLVGISWFSWTFRVDLSSHALPQIYYFLMLLIFVFSGLDFFLARLRIPFLLTLIFFVIIGYRVRGVDHYYDIVQKTDLKPLSPVEVAAASLAPDNLVVVTATGGGIWASGWTSKALQELIKKRPELINEIRLISSVSGGSVGAAYYIHDLCQISTTQVEPDSSETSESIRMNPTELNAFLDTVHKKATKPSLPAITYGLTYYDTIRLFSGGFIAPDHDRAKLHEAYWRTIAANNEENMDDEKEQVCQNMLSLRTVITAGFIPAPIFSSTAMESGRRVMITPINFDQTRRTAEEARADTLTELLFGESSAKMEADLSLWAAARLSAAFPYVTPAARARNGETRQVLESSLRSQGYHLIDGGYYDNFGITSALDWLEPVLKERMRQGTTLQFKKVTIIELRAFPVPDRDCYNPKPGGITALFGPPLGLYNIRTGSAHSRNEIEIKRFIEQWNKRFEDNHEVDVKIDRFTFEPPLDPSTESPEDKCEREGEVGALSWHLTPDQINSFDTNWLRAANSPISIQSQQSDQDTLSALMTFLEN